jgi:hypothetical protein
MLIKDKKKIEKPWAVYGGSFFSRGIGLITEESPAGNLYLRHSENQLYSDELWDPNYVMRFKTPEEAVSFFVARQERNFKKELGRVYENFPKVIRGEKLSKLCDLLNFRKKDLLTQSQPRCTK